jgi:hypothetical protein
MEKRCELGKGAIETEDWDGRVEYRVSGADVYRSRVGWSGK